VPDVHDALLRVALTLALFSVNLASTSCRVTDCTAFIRLMCSFVGRGSILASMRSIAARCSSASSAIGRTSNRQTQLTLSVLAGVQDRLAVATRNVLLNAHEYSHAGRDRAASYFDGHKHAVLVANVAVCI
jgi:hypothetical protein